MLEVGFTSVAVLELLLPPSATFYRVESFFLVSHDEQRRAALLHCPIAFFYLCSVLIKNCCLADLTSVSDLELLVPLFTTCPFSSVA